MPDSPHRADFDLELAPNEGAPEELVRLSREYWDFDGIDPEADEILWTLKVSQIDHKPWSGTAHYAAAAGLTASTLTFNCSSCEELLTLSSRQTLTDARRGIAVQCRSCNPLVDERAATVLDPKARAKRERQVESERQAANARASEADRERAHQERDDELDAKRRAVIEATYPAEDDDGGYGLSQASLDAKVGALSVIHGAGTPGGIIHPVNYDDALAPNSELARELFLAALRAGLFLIHPSSPSRAFVWDETDELKLTGSFYAHLAHFAVPGDGPIASRLEGYAGDLRGALKLDSLWSTDRRQLIALSQRLVVEEAIRYLRYFLGTHNLPDPAEHHLETLRTHASKAAANFSLGRLYRMAWSSTRDASSAYERIAGMSKDKAATHAVNKFAQWVQRALDTPEDLGDAFREDVANLPLSAATDIVFRVILGVDPMRATPLDVADALAGSPDEELRRSCDAAIPDRTELMEWLRTNNEWTDEAFRSALEVIGGEFYEPCAPDCAHERVPTIAHQAGQMFDRIVARTGRRDAAIVVGEAMVIGNQTRYRGRAGDLALSKVLEQVRTLSATTGASLQ